MQKNMAQDIVYPGPFFCPLMPKAPFYQQLPFHLLPYNIECRPCFKPFDLAFIIRMIDQYYVLAAIGVVKYCSQGFAGGKAFQSQNINGIVFLNQIIVVRIVESQGQHALFFKVGFVDSGK